MSSGMDDEPRPGNLKRFMTIGARTNTVLSSTGGHNREHLPWIASPIDRDTYRRYLKLSDSNDNQPGEDALSRRRSRIIDTPLFVCKEEVSTIELFYDLFFVANLVYFTAAHHAEDASSILNYIKLFTLMWFIWLSTALFDVRFGTESILDRCFKAVHFGVMAGFVFADSIFNSYNRDARRHSYRHFAAVLMISKLAIALQYSIVAFQSRAYKATRTPMGLTIAINLFAALGYLITEFAFPHQDGGMKWYHLTIIIILAVADGLLTMIIAMIYRIISFRNTHLVERVGLLTLIVMGEGVIGLTKSVACINNASAGKNAAELGSVISAVLLVYLIWMLYFDQIEHERFGTIRQQIWALLHYPLHIAILLCVEGNTAIIVWNSTVQGLRLVWGTRPKNFDSFATNQDFLNNLNSSMFTIDQRFRTKSWAAAYDFKKDFAAINNITAEYPFKSAQWIVSVNEVLDKLYKAAGAFVFEAHSETMYKMLTNVPGAKKPQYLQEAYEVFDVAVLTFYIGAGALLLILATMYWFGKAHKTKYELGEMGVRVFWGITVLSLGVVAVQFDKTTSGFKFIGSAWLVPLACIVFLIVLGLDKLLYSLAHRNTGGKPMRLPGSYTATENDREDVELEVQTLIHRPKPID